MTPSERRMSRRENVMGITGNIMPCNGAWTFPSVGNRQGRFPGAAGFVEEATGTLERGRRERERLCACCAHLHRFTLRSISSALRSFHLFHLLGKTGEAVLPHVQPEPPNLRFLAIAPCSVTWHC